MEDLQSLPKPSIDAVKTEAEKHEEVYLATKSFNDEQITIFDTFVGRYTWSHNERPFRSNEHNEFRASNKSKGLIFDSTGGKIRILSLVKLNHCLSGEDEK